MLKLNKVYCGDCLELMKELDDCSIDLTITSPPYDNMRDYNGYIFDFENIAKELYRVTKSGSAVVWIVGDATVKGNETGTSFKQALFFKEIGFNLYDTMIYIKGNGGIPNCARYTNAFEYMFVFSKGKLSTFNPIIDRKNKSAGRESRGSTIRERDGSLSKHASIKIKEYGTRYNIWKYYTGKGVGHSDEIAYKHPATFPENLAKDHIISWSNEGDLILDPMCGSGTACKMAKLLNRNFIGIEISKEYCQIAEERLQNCGKL